MKGNMITHRLIRVFGGDWFTEKQAREILRPEEIPALLDLVRGEVLTFSLGRYRFRAAG